jgi:hypothetical protein
MSDVELSIRNIYVNQTIKSLVMCISLEKNEVNMGFMPLAYPLFVFIFRKKF